MAEYTRECDVGQGFNFKQDEHYTFGYITGLVIGDSSLSPDFKVADPLTVPEPPKAAEGVEKGVEVKTSGVFTKPVVAVLSNVTWGNVQATDMIDFAGRISSTNMQLITNLTMQSMSKVVVRISFIVFEYDPVLNAYYPAFSSYEGSEPLGTKPGSVAGGFGANTSVKEVYGILGKDGNNFKLKATVKPADDPAGFINHEFEISVAATAAPNVQQLQIQTSSVNKMIKPWGLPRK